MKECEVIKVQRFNAEEAKSALIENKVEAMGKLFKVLGDKNRLAIVCLLKESDMCVHEIIKVLGKEQSLISHQLKILRDSKIVKTSKRKNETVYSLDDEHIGILLKIANEHVKE